MPSISPVYPGTVLQVGSSGTTTARMQTYLNALKAIYPTLHTLTVDGKFGNATKQTVVTYQALAGLSPDGKIGQLTWNSIVSKTTALNGSSADTYPGISMQSGTTGEDVTHMQSGLNECAALYRAINAQSADGAFGSNMTNATRRFQGQFSLSVDGILGKNSWNKIVLVRNALTALHHTQVTSVYPGYALNIGASGDSVRFIQSYLNAVLGKNLTIDGQYGNATKTAVVQYQASRGLKADGIVGSITWASLIAAFNATL
ncbi:MAG: peptidoglycan-binding protein [Ruthenibacterium sp.]